MLSEPSAGSIQGSGGSRGSLTGNVDGSGGDAGCGGSSGVNKRGFEEEKPDVVIKKKRSFF